METSTLYLYAKPTQFGTSQGLLLATQMIDSAPSGLPDRAQASLLDLIRKRDVLELAGAARVTVPTEESQRVLAARLGNAWGALRDGVVARARLERADGSGEATTIARLLFARGVSFVKASHIDVWAFSTHVMNIIEHQALAPRIDAIVGPMFLAAVRDAHEAFARAMTVVSSADVKVADAINALSLALGEYGRHLLGWLNLEDAANVAAFERAVTPLDAHRRSIAARRKGPVDDAEAPLTPVLPLGVPVMPAPS